MLSASTWKTILSQIHLFSIKRQSYKINNSESVKLWKKNIKVKNKEQELKSKNNQTLIIFRTLSTYYLLSKKQVRNLWTDSRKWDRFCHPDCLNNFRKRKNLCRDATCALRGRPCTFCTSNRLCHRPMNAHCSNNRSESSPIVLEHE